MANVNDFECKEYPQDLLGSIFSHQTSSIKYIPIEQWRCLYDQILLD